MKLARLTCPGCRNPYEASVERDVHFVACPVCGQNNSVPGSALAITGCCSKCGRPLDDHSWLDDAVDACP